MIFFLSKTLWLLLNPFNLFLLLIFLSLLGKFFNYYRLSKIIFSFILVLFLISVVLPSGSFLIYLLEKNFHSQVNLPEKIDGILILAGATDPFLSKEHKTISLNGSAERLIESVQLINKYPMAKVIFAGGSGSLEYPELSHSEVAKKFFSLFDIDINKIYFENKSRNTYENILFAKERFNPNINEKWIIVTSAFHLTRAMNIGKKLNWQFIPYATDFKAPKKFLWKFNKNLFINLQEFDLASHEWLGLIYYYYMGRSYKIY